ncbi:MAG: zeta toxin family protein [Pseudomonadota bacterium]
MPHLIMIAGPNGSGKTTTAPALLDKALNISAFVNADTIAQGLSAFKPESAAIEAGRIMLKRIWSLAAEKMNFAFETTLATRTFAINLIPKLKKENYQIHLTFLWLQSPDLAVSRVKERIKMGGHSVPEEVIRRRYKAGLKNFFSLYKPLIDSWQIYDNSNAKELHLIASETVEKKLTVKNTNIWKKLLEEYSNEK